MTPATVERARFATQDPDESVGYIRQMYVDNRLRVHGSATAFAFSSDLLMFGGLFVGGTQTTVASTLAAYEGADRLTVFDSRAPIRVGPLSRPSHLGPGDTICIPTGIPYEADWETLSTNLVSFAPGLLDEIGAGLLEPGQTLRFDFAGAISPAADEAWRRTCRLVRGVAAAQVGNADATLLVDELARLLASTLLSGFGNTTMAEKEATRTRPTPASLRRAVAYIESNLDQPIRLAAIAEAARVSPRALNQTFNRHLGISPIGYVHRARLDRAHRDLEAAQPGDGQTVTSVAARWGFYSLPRFGVTYRRAYGRPPSHTLRRERA